MKNFQNKVVVVTGAGSGMGRAYALEFAKLGAKLALNDYSAEGLKETEGLVAALGETAVYSESFDVSSREAFERFAASVASTLGKAHVVINNAGVAGGGVPAWDMSPENFRRTMDVNFWGVVNGTQAFLPQLIDNHEGAIVNVSSIFGLVGTPNNTDYCASKFAVRGYTESLMVELEASPLSVHLVHPGGIATNITKSGNVEDPDAAEAFAKTYLKTPPDAVARRVIQGIRQGQSKIVCGHESQKTWLGSNLVPQRLLNRILWKEFSGKGLLDMNRYKPVLRR